MVNTEIFDDCEWVTVEDYWSMELERDKFINAWRNEQDSHAQTKAELAAVREELDSESAWADIYHSMANAMSKIARDEIREFRKSGCVITSNTLFVALKKIAGEGE